MLATTRTYLVIHYAFSNSVLWATILRMLRASPWRQLLCASLRDKFAISVAPPPPPQDPVDHIQAHPNPNNILEWHFAMEGPSDTHFAGGIYHGKILFPADYPFKPPDVYFVTPNGKFKTDYALCFSFTTYHSESWNPMWSVATILGGVLSFMTDDVAHTTGSMKVSSTEKRRLARHSMEWNSNNPAFRRHFPDLVDKYHEARAKEAIQKQHR